MRNYRLFIYVTKKGEKPRIVRRYKWFTKLFKFILRNPGMFKGKMLTVHDAHGELFDISWDDVRYLADLQLKEGEFRKEIRNFRERNK